jgi:hypothetical protein
MVDLKNAIMKSYSLSRENSVRLLLMTATPITSNPMELIKLLNLCKLPHEQMPETFLEFSNEYLNEEGDFTHDGREKYKNEITEFKLRKQNPDKDTIEYMMVQCNKTEWMREAIEKNIFNTDQFIWIDFGIYHMFQNDELLEKCVLSATEKSYQSIRMPNIWYIGADHYTWDKINPIDFYLDITWYFAGSVFGGDRLSILKFADLMRGKVVSTIYEKKHIMWEINLWYMIYLELIDKKLFNIYFGSHNSGILENY